MIDIGLLVLRLVVGGLLAAHGLRKLAGWFGGPGLEGDTAYLASLGFRRPRTMAWLHGLAELAGGLALLAGFLTPVGAAVALAVLLNAALVVHRPNGLWAPDGGFEYPLVLGTTAAAIAIAGPGGLAVDTALGWELAGVPALIALIAGLVVGLAVALTAREAPRTAAADARATRGTRLEEAA